jgi:orotate phosphoribosyltransferase
MEQTMEKLKNEYINAIYAEKAFLVKEKPLRLHHGGESHLYLNHREFLSKYKYLDLLSNIYIELIPKGLENFKLGALDSQMSPVLCGLISAKLEKDIVIVKENITPYGLEQKIYGNPSGEIVLIDDMTSTGTMPINAAKALREKGATVKNLIVSACRDLSAVENTAKEDIKTLYAATFEEILKTLWEKLSDSEKNTVRKEIGEKKYNWELR